MTWAMLAPYIVQYGIEAALELMRKVESGEKVTVADLESYRVIVNKSKEDYLRESRERLGLPPLRPGA
jgi:hypothetical protein